MAVRTLHDRIDPRTRLGATVAPLVSSGACADLRSALGWVAAAGFPAVQLSVVDSELKPREFGASARRDLAATLGRHELACSGIDMFLPPAHLADPSSVSRAVEAVLAAIDFAADIGRAPLTVPVDDSVPAEVRTAIVGAASRAGVSILVPVVRAEDAVSLVPPRAASVDCAAVLASGGQPDQLAMGLGPRLGGVRVVDLSRSGMRCPILEPRESRLDALALRVALDAVGFVGYPVVDARQWVEPKQGLLSTRARWAGLVRDGSRAD